MTNKGHQPVLFLRLPIFFLLLFVFFLSIAVAGILPVAKGISASNKLKPNDPYALIFGTVWGPDDRPVYGIKVNIRRAAKKKPEWELYSDHAGEFAQRVPAGQGDYVVGADLKGVKTRDGQPLRLAQEVDVHVEYDERVDIGLHLTR
jgi:hypothetical protein